MSIDSGRRTGNPVVGKISVSDVGAALAAGWRDFLKAPLFGLFFGGVFVAGGVVSALLLYAYGEVWMIIPFAIGFPLIGPFAAAGLYEVSRILGRGEKPDWRSVLISVFSQRERQMAWMAFVVLFVFWVWLYLARILLALFLGFKAPASFSGFANVVFGTPEGLMFLAVGTLVGGVLALVLFSLTVVAMPLLLDTDRDFVTAMITSVRSVTENPVPLLLWGLIVGVLAFVALLPAFVGLVIIFPVLGHATWHLYRRVITSA